LFGQAERSLGSKSSAFPPPFDIFEMNGSLPEAQEEMRIFACVAWESFVHSPANNIGTDLQAASFFLNAK